jgi:poly(A) polymerase
VTSPVIVPRADHPISRRNIDPDALRVLYRLHANQHKAFLVGGSVRDMLLGRHPKDFDIGTDAHPNQIKRLFRNCWIIGRRFRLAHIKFGTKTIEVATFRKLILDTAPEPAAEGSAPAPIVTPHTDHGLIHRDNTFGTPEEDAFRRDFTINGLFYDVATRTVIDFVGGLQDLERRLIRSIGDPRLRFVEDPVRMLRAAVFGARLGFDLDPLVIEAIAEHRGLILKASPSRLIEEYYKILRSGYAEASFRALSRLRLLELITPELKSPADAVWDSLARLDRYRQQFPQAPAELTNTILIGSVLVPLGVLDRPVRVPQSASPAAADRVSFGVLPVARRDLERLRQISQISPRLLAGDLPPRVARGLVHRPSFDDALAWVQVFEEASDAVARWQQLRQQRAPRHPHEHGQPAHPPGNGPGLGPGAAADARPKRRRRRRRRRGRGPATT